MRGAKVCDSSRALCPNCGLKLHGVRVDIGSTWARCEKCKQGVYLVGTLGGVTLTWAVTGAEFQKLSNAGMLPRDVLYALEVLTLDRVSA